MVLFISAFFIFLFCEECFFCSALQLHPDKNKHPKAEIAFKLVSEVRLHLFHLFSVFLKILHAEED
jgi:hypothetical protein